MVLPFYSLVFHSLPKYSLNMLPLIAKKVETILAPKPLDNIVQSSYLIRSVRKFSGASVITINSTPQNVIVSTFTFFGFLSFISWYSVYFYCVYKIYIDDQTILRSLYDTKLKHYGDEVERVTNIIFVIYAMWKVPFDLSGSTDDMQQIVDIDQAIRDLGENVAYTKNLHSVIIICVAQVTIISTRLISIWISLLNLNKPLPAHKLYEVIFTDAIAFIIIAQFCSYLLLLRNRYKMVNKMLTLIKVSKNLELFVIRFKQPESTDNESELHNKFIAERIKSCGRVYSMLYSAAQSANDKFGFVLLLTMLVTLFLIILHLFYFMEATAAGLFNDSQKYIHFLIYIFWQISYALCLIYSVIHFSEGAVKEARLTSQITHQIINSNLDSTVRNEAVNLSLQILHQTPKFMAHGLYKLDHEMLLEGARSVTTFLVILLQFVTDKRAG